MKPCLRPSIRRLLSLALILPLSLRLAGAEPADQPELKRIVTEFDAEVLAKITPGYEETMSGLKLKYSAVLKQGLAKATKAGDLSVAVPFQKEIERADNGTVMPDNDTGLPPELQKLRSNFRTGAKKAADTRGSRLAVVVGRYDRTLEELQTSLTKAGKLDDALAVKDGRDSLKAKISDAPQSTIGRTPGHISRVRVVREVPQANTDGWITLYEDGRLYGCSPDLDLIRNDKIAQQDGCLRLDGVDLKFSPKALDLEMRVTLKKVSGTNATLSVRYMDDGLAYSAWFNGGNNFGVGRMVRGNFENMVSTTSGPLINDFYEYKITVVGSSIQTYVNGTKQFDFHNTEITEPGKVTVMALGGVSLFRKIQIRVLK